MRARMRHPISSRIARFETAKGRQQMTSERQVGRGRAWVVLTFMVALTACAGGVTETTAAAAGDETISVFGAYATQIEEPWDGVIHRALEAEQAAGRISY